MVSLLRKKKPSNQSVGSPKDNGARKNQLVQAVSPFDECLPTNDSFCFKKGFTLIRRKHSTQRDQLAKLKAGEILALADSDHARNMQSRLLTGLLPSPAPARSKPTTNMIALSPHQFLTKPIQLRHQGTTRASILSTATTNTKNKKMSKLSSGSGRKKHLVPLFRPSDMLVGGGCAVMSGAHQVPCTISITHLNDYDEDASSEVSLEDVLLHMSTSTATASVEHTTATGTTATSVEKWPSYPGALASAACMPMTVTDLQSTDSSISWPSDEDDDDESLDEDDDDEDVELDPSSLQLITEVRELNCTDEVGSFVKAEFGCAGGFKFWSDDTVQNENLDFGRKGDEDATAARDEENCRDDTDSDKPREENLGRMESF